MVAPICVNGENGPGLEFGQFQFTGRHKTLLPSSSSGDTLEEHSRFHDASPGRTIRRSPQCRVKSKVERFEIAVDCSKPGLTRSASWTAPVNREAIGGCS